MHQSAELAGVSRDVRFPVLISFEEEPATMFSTIIDVAIGMVFIYLLLSLMCSAANEIIELFLKKRAIDLERGIREMLAPGTDSGKDDIVKQIYNHPLVNNLFGKRYEDSRITSKARYLWRTLLPSYIPARSFALALMDLLTSSARAATPAAAVPLGAPPAPNPPLSGATGSTPASNFEVKLTEPAPAPLAPGAPNNPLNPLREAISKSPLLVPVDPLKLDVRPGLIALVDAAGDDVAKARENIETWFNNSMDRVSSWYKRRTQVIILILGLVIAVATNADSITIAQKLSTDEDLRESLVAAAQEYSKAHAEPSPTGDSTKQTNGESNQTAAGSAAPGTSPAPTESPSPNPTPTPCPSPAPTPPQINLPPECKDLDSADCKTKLPTVISECSNLDSAECKTKSEFLSVCLEDPKSQECKQARILFSIPECVADKDSPVCKEMAVFKSIPACNVCKPGKDPKESPQCKLEANRRQLEALNLPIGWGSVDDVQRKWPGSNFSGPGGWLDQTQWHFFGWLLTALAISLGAPFWFDLLNKFIVIRSAVKPHEKSPEEESKD